MKKIFLILLLFLNVVTVYPHSYDWLKGVMVGTGYISDDVFEPEKSGMDIDIHSYLAFFNLGYTQNLFFNSDAKYKCFAGIGLGNLFSLQVGTDFQKTLLRARFDAISLKSLFSENKFLKKIHISTYYEFSFGESVNTLFKIGLNYSIFDDD